MANQVEVSKLVPYALFAPPADCATVSKLVMYLVAVPSDAGDTSNKQGHVHTRIITRRI